MSDHHDHHALQGDYEDPLAAPTWVIGIAGTAILIALILGVTALAYAMRSSEAQRISVRQPVVQLENLRAAQQSRLEAGPHRELRNDSPEGEASIVIPLSQAMQLTAEEFRAGGGGR